MGNDTIMEALKLELQSIFSNIRFESNDVGNPVRVEDLFFSVQRDGFAIWRHAIRITLSDDKIVATPGPYFSKVWQWGHLKSFGLADPDSIQNLIDLIKSCTHADYKTSECATPTSDVQC